MDIDKKKLTHDLIEFITFVALMLRAIAKESVDAFDSLRKDNSQTVFVVNGVEISRDELEDIIRHKNKERMVFGGRFWDKRYAKEVIKSDFSIEYLQHIFQGILFCHFHLERLPRSLLPPLPDQSVIPRYWFEYRR